MKKVYNVIHHYDVDGGIGDAIDQKEIIFTTSSKKVAKEFVNKYSNNHIYDIPYAKLYRGLLEIEELRVIESWKNIPKKIIKWGKENKKEEYYIPDNQDYNGYLYPCTD